LGAVLVAKIPSFLALKHLSIREVFFYRKEVIIVKEFEGDFDLLSSVYQDMFANDIEKMRVEAAKMQPWFDPSLSEDEINLMAQLKVYQQIVDLGEHSFENGYLEELSRRLDKSLKRRAVKRRSFC